VEDAVALRNEGQCCPALKTDGSWIAFTERDGRVWRICEVCGRWTPLSDDLTVEGLAQRFAAADDIVSGPGFSTVATPGGGVVIRMEDAMADWVAHPLEMAEEPIWNRRNVELGWIAAKSVVIAAALLWRRELWDPFPNLLAWLGALILILGIERVRLTAGLRLAGRVVRGRRAIKDAVLVPMLGPCGHEITVGVRTGGRDPITLSDAEAEEALLKILRRVNRLGLDLDLGQKERKAARAAVRAAGGPRGFLAALVSDGKRPVRKLSRVDQFALELSVRHVAEERRVRSLIRFVAGKGGWIPKGSTMGEIQGEAGPDLAVEGGRHP